MAPRSPAPEASVGLKASDPIATSEGLTIVEAGEWMFGQSRLNRQGLGLADSAAVLVEFGSVAAVAAAAARSFAVMFAPLVLARWRGFA